MTKRLLLFFALARLLIRPLFFRLKGAQIGRLVVLGKAGIQGDLYNLTVGDQTSLGKCEISLHDTVKVGCCVVINDGAVLLTASHSVSDPQWSYKKSPITIGDYAWIATNAIILPGVLIGKGAVVGAGAVVRGDVPDYAVVTGNPSTVQSVQRTRALAYSAVLSNAPFEAWIGRNLTNINSELV
ncbi:MAG: acyltransferase [Glaciimonas sp.]|nr:acyltransferase [Glaciimonas sp.]